MDKQMQFMRENARQAARRAPMTASPGRSQCHGFKYKRNGTLSLFAAFNTATGEVLGNTAARHTSEQFVTFLQDIVAGQSSRREIRAIYDNFTTTAAARRRSCGRSWPNSAAFICTTRRRIRRG